METSIDLHCPACGRPLTPRLGCCSGCLARALQLQMRRFGVEVSCLACGRDYVVRCLDSPGALALPGTVPRRHDGPRSADRAVDAADVSPPDAPPPKRS